MFIARYAGPEGSVALGRVDADVVTPLRTDAAQAAIGVAAVLDADPAALVESAAARIPLAEVTLLAPVPRPGKIVCVGVNYAAHAAESGHEAPAHPEIFAKFANTVANPGDPIAVTDVDEAIDYEGELAAIVGRRVHGELTAEQALAAIGGYTVANDVTARTWQLRVSQWTVGKSFDGTCPLGPWVATSASVPDPQALALRTRVGDELLQDDHTSNMLFGVADIVRYLARAMTLEPGDTILTGTPEGVGVARSPQRFLRPGETVSVEIEGIGTLTNPVVAG
jgi:2-keto-4-pentenoate hydratase/2-oxohepta-3-ene-1,7-dioic acid hydratase in catechol pathway